MEVVPATLRKQIQANPIDSRLAIATSLGEDSLQDLSMQA